jgi:ATP-dependent HslUV protease ATP-binding subunit HslU
MERLLEDVLFSAPDCDSTMTVDAAEVDKSLGDLVKDEDLSRYIL